MKKLVSLLLTFVMILGMLTVFAGCGAPKDDGAEINIYLGSEVFDFDPSDYYVSSNAERVLSLIYEPLFTVNENGKVKCAAAKDYDVDEDDREITIEIRETYWSDNIPVKASDFVYTWCERIINPVNPNPAAALFLDIEGVREAIEGNGSIWDVGIKATEMDEITITYRQGADYKRILKNLASIATAPVRQDAVEVAETYWSKSSVVTNGPFRVKSYDHDKGTFELARNVGYHQDFTIKDYDNQVRPGLLYGNFVTFSDSDVTVSYSDIENKVVFVMAEASLADRAKYKKKADTADHTSTYTYVFNTSHPLFSDVNVRLALSAAIDRNAIIKAITFGKAANGLIPDVSGGANKDFISSGANMEKARQYLAAADQNVVNAHKAFTLTIDLDEQSKAIADIVKTAWEALGFEVTINAVGKTRSILSDGTDFYDSAIQYLMKDASYGKVNYDVIAVDWQTYSTDALAGLAALTSTLNGMGKEQIDGVPGLGGTVSTSKARSNVAVWSDAKYDQLVLEASASPNKDERARLLAEAEEYLMSKMPVCPLVFNQSFVFTGSKISKVKFDGLGHLILTDAKLSNYKKYFKPEETED